MPVVSSRVNTYVDVQGNREVRGQFLIEFTDATYFAGRGEIMDFSPYMQRVEYATAQPVQLLSSAIRSLVVPNMLLYPGNAGSGAFQIVNATSGLLEAVSGAAYSGLRAVVTVVGA